MRVVLPIAVTEDILISSTISEPDTGEVVYVTGPSLTGERFILTSTHRAYEVVAIPSTTNDPETGISAVPPTWVDVGPTNKFAMFDNINSTRSEETTTLVVEVKPGVVANSIAGFNISGVTNVNVTVTDPIDGEVYNTDVAIDNSQLSEFFDDDDINSEFILLDLPFYSNATTKLTATGTSIKFGNFVIGNKTILGVAKVEGALQLLDFGKKETDTFGNTVVKPGRTAKLVDFEVSVDFNNVSFVFDVLSSITSIPSAWVATDEVNDPTLVFGYYRDYQESISSATITNATITVEGLA